MNREHGSKIPLYVCFDDIYYNIASNELLDVSDSDMSCDSLIVKILHRPKDGNSFSAMTDSNEDTLIKTALKDSEIEDKLSPAFSGKEDSSIYLANNSSSRLSESPSFTIDAICSIPAMDILSNSGYKDNLDIPTVNSPSNSSEQPNTACLSDSSKENKNNQMALSSGLSLSKDPLKKQIGAHSLVLSTIENCSDQRLKEPILKPDKKRNLFPSQRRKSKLSQILDDMEESALPRNTKESKRKRLSNSSAVKDAFLNVLSTPSVNFCSSEAISPDTTELSNASDIVESSFNSSSLELHISDLSDSTEYSISHQAMPISEHCIIPGRNILDKIPDISIPIIPVNECDIPPLATPFGQNVCSTPKIQKVVKTSVRPPYTEKRALCNLTESIQSIRNKNLETPIEISNELLENKLETTILLEDSTEEDEFDFHIGHDDVRHLEMVVGFLELIKLSKRDMGLIGETIEALLKEAKTSKIFEVLSQRSTHSTLYMCKYILTKKAKEKSEGTDNILLSLNALNKLINICLALSDSKLKLDILAHCTLGLTEGKTIAFLKDVIEYKEILMLVDDQFSLLCSKVIERQGNKMGQIHSSRLKISNNTSKMTLGSTSCTEQEEKCGVNSRVIEKSRPANGNPCSLTPERVQKLVQNFECFDPTIQEAILSYLTQLANSPETSSFASNLFKVIDKKYN